MSAGAIALAVITGISAWISLGTLAVTGHDGSRVGALPPWWVLGVSTLTAVAAVVALRLTARKALPLTLLGALWIPWLPLPLPTSLLVWEGPPEVLIWFAALGGVVIQAVRVPERQRAWWSSPTRAPWLLAAALFTCSIGAAGALRTLLPGGDEPHYLVIAQSLLYDGDLKIENNHQQGDFLAYIDHDLPPHYLRRGVDGAIYSIHAPGVAALLLPAFAVAGYAGAVVFLSALNALAAAVLWRAAHLLTNNSGAAWVGVAVVATSATSFLHSFTIFPDPVGAAVMALVVLCLARLSVVPAAVSLVEVFSVGAALALLPWFHTRFALLAGAAGVVLIARLLRSPRDLGRVAVFLSVPALSAIAWLTFFYVIYGTANPSAPYGGSRQTALAWIPSGIAGLLFDQQFGLLANAPALVVLPLGVLLASRQHRRLAVEHVAIAAPYVAAVAAFAMWWGGWSAPARFLVAVMPLAVVPIAFVWARGGVAFTATVTALLVIGVVNVLARVVIEDGALLYNTRDGFDLLLDWLSRTINLPLALPSVHRLGTEVALQVASAWLISGAIAVLVLRLLRPGHSLGVKWTVTGWTFIACVAIAMSASSKLAHTVMLTPESSELHFIQRWRTGADPLAVRIAPWRMARTDSALSAIELRSSARARELRSDQALLALRRVPPGDYQVVVEGGADLTGTLNVSIGTTSLATEQWRLDGLRSGLTPFTLHAPAMLHSVTIRGDDAANDVVQRVSLRPVRVQSNGVDRDGFVWHAARYGTVRAYFLDDLLYMEPAGLWTAGDATGEMIVSCDHKDSVEVAISAGPVETQISILVDGKSAEDIALQPGERRVLTIPVGLWQITTRGMFRPADHDAANTDARPLGARLEFQ